MNRVKLKNIAIIVMGQSPQAQFVSSDFKVGLPLLNGPAEFTNTFPIPVQYTSDPKRKAEANDILFCVRGSTTGRMNIADQTYAIGRGLAAIKHKNGHCLNPYIKAVIDTNLKKLLGGTLGSVFPNVTKDNLFDLEFFCHELPTQQKIASVLSALDDKIELNNKINTELEAMAKILYNYWFVQFDFPNEEGKPYKSSGGKMIYNDFLKKEIPEGWEESQLGNLANLIRGVSYGKDDILEVENEDSICILRATNISGNKVDINNPIIIPKKLVSSNQILNPFDILITMSSGSIDHIGKNGFYLLDNEVSYGAFCAKLVPKHNLRYFVYHYLQSEFVMITIKNECLGTNINNMNSSMVNNFKVVEPNKKTLVEFNKHIEPIYSKIQNIYKQNQELTQLRDWLLPMLMNGQVKVTDHLEMNNEPLAMVAEPELAYSSSEEKTTAWYDQRFELWVNQQGLAARGTLDKATLRELFDAMNDEDK